MIVRPCPSCNLPVAFDAFGNTDHVCFNINLPDVDLALRPAAGERDVRIIIESAAQGVGGWFERQWRERRHPEVQTFLPWFHAEETTNDDD
jgi:hypothetical protein